MATTKKNSLPIYRADGIMATVTGLTDPSTNKKTGNMLQTNFMNSEVEPHTALKTGQDSKVCFTCALSSIPNGGNGDCYVLVFQGPLSVYRAVKNLPTEETPDLPEKPVRLGAYGDPTAVPIGVLNRLVAPTKAFPKGRPSTGYTHAWRRAKKEYASLLMASVDSESEAKQAQALGYRTYRVLPTEGTPLMANEILCPHTGPKQVKCVDCMLCSGNRSKAKNIAVVKV